MLFALLALGASAWPARDAGAQAAPSLTLSPSSGAVGSTVRAVGGGFCGTAACSSVQLTFGGIVVADGITVGPDRGFAITVVVPGGLPPGGQAVAATQSTATGHQRAAIATFQVVLRPAPSGTPSLSPSGSASPTPALSPSSSVSPAGGGGTSPGIIWGMVAAGAVFFTAVAGMLYIVWRSREVGLPLPPGTFSPDHPSPPVLTHAGPPERGAVESALGKKPDDGNLEPGPIRPHPGDDETAG